MLDTALSVLRALKDIYEFVKNVYTNIEKTHGLLNQTRQQIDWAITKQEKLKLAVKTLHIVAEEKEALVTSIQESIVEKDALEKELRKQQRRLKPIRLIIKSISKRVVGTHSLMLALEMNIKALVGTLKKMMEGMGDSMSKELNEMMAAGCTRIEGLMQQMQKADDSAQQAAQEVSDGQAALTQTASGLIDDMDHAVNSVNNMLPPHLQQQKDQLPSEVVEHIKTAILVALGLEDLGDADITPALLARFMGDDYTDEIEKLFAVIKKGKAGHDSVKSITQDELVNFLKEKATTNYATIVGCVMQGLKMGTSSLVEKTCGGEIFERYQTLMTRMFDPLIKMVLKLGMITETLALPEPDYEDLAAKALLDAMNDAAMDFAEDCAAGVPSLSFCTSLAGINSPASYVSSASQMLGKFTSLMEGFTLEEFVGDASEIRAEASEYAHKMSREITILAADSTLMLPAAPSKSPQQTTKKKKFGVGTASYTGADRVVEMNVRRQGKMMAHMVNEHENTQKVLASMAGMLQQVAHRPQTMQHTVGDPRAAQGLQGMVPKGYDRSFGEQNATAFSQGQMHRGLERVDGLRRSGQQASKWRAHPQSQFRQ